MIYSHFILIFALIARVAPSHSIKKLPTDNLIFYETFDEEDVFASGKWVVSKDPKYSDQQVVIKGLSKPLKGLEDEKGVVLAKEMKHYAFGTQFAKAVGLKDRDLVIQYEVKLEEGLNCGGAYIKLPRATDDLDFSKLTSSTPYSIMFGPDKCGSNNKVHFIFQHQNPLSGAWEEKHFNDTPTAKTDKVKTHLYTLHLKTDSSFEIYIDKKRSKSGSLLTHMNPPINPPKEIDDPDDKKPEDWVDEAKIDDPTAVKPDDWDEDAPKMIEDVNAVKPKDWLDDAPAKISDPNAEKPEDWDDDEDGEWEAPLVENPACAKAGCGVWKRPMIKNPDYKGKWKAPKINNPAYKGPWSPRKIANPHWFEDPMPAANMAPIGGLAVEVWTTTGGIFFDNFVVSRTLQDAFAFADATWQLKAAAEGTTEKKEKKEKAQKNREKKSQEGGVKAKAEAKLEELIEFVTENAWASAATLIAIALAIALLSVSGGKKAKKAKPVSVPEPDAAPASTASSSATADASETKEGEQTSE